MKKVTRPAVHVTVRLRVLAKPSATAPVRDVKNTRRLPASHLVPDREDDGIRDSGAKHLGTSDWQRPRSSQNQHNVVGIDRDDKRSKRQNKTMNVPILGSSRRPLAGANFLGVRTVQPESAEIYKQSLRKFTKWATVNGRRLVEDDEVDDAVDDAVVDYMNERIFARRQETPEF